MLTPIFITFVPSLFPKRSSKTVNVYDLIRDVSHSLVTFPRLLIAVLDHNVHKRTARALLL
jgi:hypothetical protein